MSVCKSTFHSGLGTYYVHCERLFVLSMSLSLRGVMYDVANKLWLCEVSRNKLMENCFL